MNSDHKVLEEVTLHPAQCQVSCPALLSPWGSALIAVSAFHRHLWQRHLPCGSILMQVTSSCPVSCTTLEGGMKPWQSCSRRFP